MFQIFLLLTCLYVFFNGTGNLQILLKDNEIRQQIYSEFEKQQMHKYTPKRLLQPDDNYIFHMYLLIWVCSGAIFGLWVFLMMVIRIWLKQFQVLDEGTFMIGKISKGLRDTFGLVFKIMTVMVVRGVLITIVCEDQEDIWKDDIEQLKGLNDFFENREVLIEKIRQLSSQLDFLEWVSILLRVVDLIIVTAVFYQLYRIHKLSKKCSELTAEMKRQKQYEVQFELNSFFNDRPQSKKFSEVKDTELKSWKLINKSPLKIGGDNKVRKAASNMTEQNSDKQLSDVVVLKNTKSHR